MAKGPRRNAKPRSACVIKALTSYYGNICVHLQDAETSQKVEQALDNLKIDDESVERLKVGEKVLVAVTTSGKIKFRRAMIDMLTEHLCDATDLDTNEYYADVDRRSVYSIQHLKDVELIEAAPAEAYYVHGYHSEENVVNPKQLEKLFKILKGMRWYMQKTGTCHAIDAETPVIKLLTEKNRSLETVTKIKANPRQETVMPQLFHGPTEEVRVFCSDRTMGVQLRYLPQKELRRLEVFMTEGLDADSWRVCESSTTEEGDLVAALYNGRRVRGYVVEVRPGGARVFLMDYGLIEKFRYQRLWHLSKDLAFKLPRYGLQVQLPAEPDDFFDECFIEVSLERQLDDLTLQGEILRSVEETGDEPSEVAQPKARATEQEQDQGTDADSEPVADASESENSSALRPESLSPALANYLGSTNENFVVQSEDRSPPSTSRAIDGAPVSLESPDRPPLSVADEPAPGDDDKECVGDTDPTCEAIPVGPGESLPGDESAAAAGDVAAAVSGKENAEVLESSDPVGPADLSPVTPDDSKNVDDEREPEKADASGDRNREKNPARSSSSQASSDVQGDKAAIPLKVEDECLVEGSAEIVPPDGEDGTDDADQPGNTPEVPGDEREHASPEIHTALGDPPKSSASAEEFEVPNQPEGLDETPMQATDMTGFPSVEPPGVVEPEVESGVLEEDLRVEDQPEAQLEVSGDIVDSADPTSANDADMGDNAGANRECEEKLGAIGQSGDVAEVSIQSAESATPLAKTSGEGITTSCVDTADDGRKVLGDRGTEEAHETVDYPEDTTCCGENSDETRDPMPENTEELKTRDQARQAPQIPIPQEVVEIEQFPMKVIDDAQASVQKDDSWQRDEARVPSLEENVKKSREAEPMVAAVPQASPVKSKSCTEKRVEESRNGARLQDLNLPFNSSDPVLIVQVGKSRRESTKSKITENRNKTVDARAGKLGLNVVASKAVHRADDQAQASAKRDLPKPRIDAPDSAGRTTETLPLASRDPVLNIPVPDDLPGDTDHVEVHAEGQFDDAEDDIASEVYRKNAVADQVPKKDAVAPVYDAENLPEHGFASPTAEQGDKNTSNLDAVVPEVEATKDEVSQNDIEEKAPAEDVSEPSTSGSSPPDPNIAEQIERRDVREATRTILRDVVPETEGIPGRAREERTENAAAETTPAENPTQKGSCSNPNTPEHLENIDASEGRQDLTQSSKVPQAEKVEGEDPRGNSVVDAVIEPSASRKSSKNSSGAKIGQEKRSDPDAAESAAVRRKHQTRPLETVSKVEKGHGNIRRESLDKSLAGTSASGTPSQNKSCVKYGTKMPMHRKASREDTLVKPARVRDFCRYPRLTFDTGKVLLATVTWIVNNRQILMTHDACLASIEAQLENLVEPKVETPVRVGKTVLVDIEGRFRRACVAGHLTGDVYDIYLLDYPECLSTSEFYECPPALAAVPRALLFVQLMGSQDANSQQIGDKCKVAIDRFDGSIISGLVLPYTECSAVQ